MNYLKHFFSYDFQFYVNPIRIETVDQIFLGISLLALVLALVFKIRTRFNKNEITKHFTRRLTALFATMGALGILWYGARYQHVSLFGSHFVFLVILLIGLIWFFYVARYWWKQYKPEKMAWEKEQIKLKYLNQ